MHFNTFHAKFGKSENGMLCMTPPVALVLVAVNNKNEDVSETDTDVDVIGVVFGVDIVYSVRNSPRDPRVENHLCHPLHSTIAI